MIHGTSKIELTYDSIVEAIEEWLQGHMAPNVTVKVCKWETVPGANYSTVPSGIKVEFKQFNPAEDPAPESTPTSAGRVAVRLGMEAPETTRSERVAVDRQGDHAAPKHSECDPPALFIGEVAQAK